MALANQFILNTSLANSGKMSQERQFEWLERSKQWPGLDPTEWQARRVLGMGTFGLVGQWDYIGNDPTKPRNIAIKQTAPDEIESMAAESKFLHLIASTGTKHVVKLYKAAHRDAGTGTMKEADPLPFDRNGDFNADLQVNRMYLEFAPSSDMYGWMSKLRSPVRNPPEEHMWRILQCIAKALHVLEYGTEEPTARDTTWNRKIAHFDIKHQNILIGDRDSIEHRRLEIFKLADFGLSLFVPNDFKSPQARHKWISDSHWRASPGFKAPEQHFRAHHNRDIGKMTGIWSAGAVMWHISAYQPPDVQYVFNHKLKPNSRHVQISGEPDVLFNIANFPYSKIYIDTLCACLAYDPAERISIEDLLTRCQGIIAIYDRQTANDPIIDDSLTSSNSAAFNILPDGPDPVDPRFKLQNNKRAVAQWMADTEPGAPTDIAMPTPDGPYLPQLLFPTLEPGLPPTLADYPFTGFMSNASSSDDSSSEDPTSSSSDLDSTNGPLTNPWYVTLMAYLRPRIASGILLTSSKMALLVLLLINNNAPSAWTFNGICIVASLSVIFFFIWI